MRRTSSHSQQRLFRGEVLSLTLENAWYGILRTDFNVCIADGIGVGMENLVYLFSCFLSCTIVAGLMFQFMGDRYEKDFVNPWVYRIAAAASVVIVTLVNLKHSTWWNMAANFMVFGIVSFIFYVDKSGRRYWRVLESECFFDDRAV
ncbi:hypothetical protein [Parablautia muri]|uniref:Uncharacterized protein n=1 Tax=Parablautia muri TaxID=2320879 RepID=A0A9X5BL36_9FIRM|nr:hypothetical protein [Parablautia muri]NBJ95714.1 hypothetical protein [Parablautia muri]